MKGIKKTQVRGEGQRCKKYYFMLLMNRCLHEAVKIKIPSSKLLACLLLINR